MKDFEQAAAKLARAKEEVRYLQEQLHANTEALNLLQAGLVKSNETIEAWTVNVLVKPEKLTENIRAILALIPADSRSKLAKSLCQLFNIDCDKVVNLQIISCSYFLVRLWLQTSRRFFRIGCRMRCLSTSCLDQWNLYGFLRHLDCVLLTLLGFPLTQGKRKVSELSHRQDWEKYLKYKDPQGYTFSWVEGKENVWVSHEGTYVHAIVKKKDSMYWVVELQTTKNVCFVCTDVIVLF
jgi:hypothetical protein